MKKYIRTRAHPSLLAAVLGIALMPSPLLRASEPSREESLLSSTTLVGTPVLSSAVGTAAFTSGSTPLAIGGFVGGGLTTTGYAALYFISVRTVRNSAITGGQSTDQSARGQTSGGAGRSGYVDAMQRLEILRGHQEEARELLARGEEGGESPDLQRLTADVQASAARCGLPAEPEAGSRAALGVLASTSWDESFLQRLEQMPDRLQVEACRQ